MLLILVLYDISPLRVIVCVQYIQVVVHRFGSIFTLHSPTFGRGILLFQTELEPGVFYETHESIANIGGYTKNRNNKDATDSHSISSSKHRTKCILRRMQMRSIAGWDLDPQIHSIAKYDFPYLTVS